MTRSRIRELIDRINVIDTFPCYACKRECAVIREPDGDSVCHEEPPCSVFEGSDPDAFARYCDHARRP